MLAEKKGEFKVYQTINYCENALKAHLEDDVALYHAGFLKLYKWLMAAIDARKMYIARTKALFKRDSEDRVKKQEAAGERANNREHALIEARERFNEEHKEEI